MAHEITIHNDRARAVYGRDLPPWHTLGTIRSGLLTAAEVVADVCPPRIVTRVPWFGVKGDDDDNIQEAPDFRLTCAEWEDGTLVPIGQVGRLFKPVQFADAFTIFDPLIREYGACYDAAGVLSGGAGFWVLAKLPDLSVIGGKDKHENFLLCSTKNDGTAKTRVKPTKIRVVCRNTEQMALVGGESEIAFRHVGDTERNIKHAAESVEEALAGLKAGDVAFEKMFAKQVDKEDRARMVAAFFGWNLDDPTEKESLKKGRRHNMLQEIVTCLNQEARAFPDAKGTVYETYNAMTRWIDHYQPTHEGKKLESLGFGTGAKRREKAFALATSFTDKGTFDGVVVPDTLPENL